ncbi:MBL fold metallo-hydrolase [Rhodococcus rhodochrous]|uniref:MBL fold metallo-hydrolase n=1 Tax=Rhodococcus rhodochrous TaxID=1829 RepID=A0AA47ADX1_RHORH|nr:MBL fold metallo-hydrolase [Rhodococcus rhodochrous]UZF48231.1 MBL fold metallo-hydrolase [Rhodococcus rhodochrous]
MRIGDIEITPLIDGEAVVAGNAFYPNLTDSDWDPYNKLLEPVFHQCQHLNTLGGYLVRAGDRIIVVDGGAGPQPKWPFAGGGFRSSLAATGLDRADVTDVIFTHLHFDHIGWASVDGKPYFPNATYHIDQRDWNWFLAPDFGFTDAEVDKSMERLELSANFCYPENDAPAVRLRPIVEQTKFFQADEELELLPGVVALDGSGHTPGQVVLELRSQGESGLLLGDLVHAQPELVDDNARGQWNFISHTDHDRAHAAVERFRKRLWDEKIPAAGGHFPGLRWGHVVRDGNKRVWEDIRG